MIKVIYLVVFVIAFNRVFKSDDENINSMDDVEHNRD
jgi:hypothetical protein